MHRTGLAPYGQDDDAVRWIAVRHGADHIHIVAMLARQDGGRPRLSNERYRVREACRAAEERYGLRRTAPGDRTAARRPTCAENEKARRCGWRETPRVTLKRAVSTAAAGASREQEFFTRLDGAGVLVRKRLSARNPAEVTGYAVALPGDAAQDGGPVWFGGGKLAADLTLPKLRRRWEPARVTPEDKFTALERDALWEIAARTAADASAQIRSHTATSPAAAADAAWAAADTMHAAAAALGSRILRQAANSYDRAARAPYCRIPTSTPAGNRAALEAVQRLWMSAVAAISSCSSRTNAISRSSPESTPPPGSPPVRVLSGAEPPDSQQATGRCDQQSADAVGHYQGTIFLTGAAQARSNSPALIATVNARQPSGPNASTGPPGSFESRTARPSSARTAISTQLPPLLPL